MSKKTKPRAQPQATPMDAIASKCLDCICGQQQQIESCAAAEGNVDICALWPLVKAESQGDRRPGAPLKAIRAECLRCMDAVFKGVKACPSRDCPLWAFRFGMLPATAQKRGLVVDP